MPLVLVLVGFFADDGGTIGGVVDFSGWVFDGMIGVSNSTSGSMR